MKRCKTCKHWEMPIAYEADKLILCDPNPDTGLPMQREFQVRVCKMPTQTFGEPVPERDGFGLADGDDYYAVMATAEEFGCVKHEDA